MIYPKITITHVLRNVVQEFVFLYFIKENVLILTGSDFSESLLRGKRYGQSQYFK